MSKSHWKLDQLKTHLSRKPEIKGWIVSQEHVHRRERYFMTDGQALVIDQDRSVKGQNIHLTLFVNLPGKPGRQGEISKKLFAARALEEQIDSAIEAALQTDHQAWKLPDAIPSTLPHLASCDPRIAEDVDRAMNELTARIERSVSHRRPSEFNSSELFLSVHDRELHLSNGLVHRSSQSRVYTEAAFSFSRKGSDGKPQSDEYLDTRWSVSLDDIPVERIFEETAERAEKSLDVRKPRTGKYPVIVDAEVLAAIFNAQLGKLSSGNAYHGLPFVAPGEAFVAEASGDLLTVTLDPTLEFGADTIALAEDGLAQAPLRLVEKNRVLNTMTSKRYADYRSIAPTTIRGNIVIEPGTLTHAELTHQAPQVIEILQFSGLFVDPNTSTFSSEIRLARLHDNEAGTVIYLKGGSLSGSFADNFKGVRLSTNRVKRAHFSSNVPHGDGYFGPEHALLSDVSIVG